MSEDPSWPPDADAVRRVQALSAEPLSREAFLAYIHAPWAKGEREETWSLIDWFTRRYATPAARLSYATRKYGELYDPRNPLRPPPPLRLPETPVVDLDAPPAERDRLTD